MRPEIRKRTGDCQPMGIRAVFRFPEPSLSPVFLSSRFTSPSGSSRVSSWFLDGLGVLSSWHPLPRYCRAANDAALLPPRRQVGWGAYASIKCDGQPK
jgi:hypothetical protein